MSTASENAAEIACGYLRVSSPAELREEFIDEIGGWLFSHPSRGGGSCLVDGEGHGIMIPSAVDPDDGIASYVKGARDF